MLLTDAPLECHVVEEALVSYGMVRTRAFYLLLEVEARNQETRLSFDTLDQSNPVLKTVPESPSILQRLLTLSGHVGVTQGINVMYFTAERRLGRGERTRS